MRIHHSLFIGILVMSVTLAGCLEAPSDPEPGRDGEDPAPEPAPETTIHRPGTKDEPATVVNETGDGATDPVLATLTGTSRFTGFGAFEPTLGVTSDGTLFMTTIEGTAGIDYTSIIRSTDQGETWERINPQIGPLSSPPQSNDPYMYVDADTDRVYNLDMQGLACNYIQWSDDEGETWTQNPLGCGQPPVLDHPSIFSGPPRELEPLAYENIVYLCVNRIADSACATSLDGGMSWLGFIPVYTAAQGACGGLHGHGVTGPDGRAYLGKNQCGTASIAVSEDDGLSWQVHEISDDVGAKRHDVELAVDDNGTVYALWISDDDLPYLAYSEDHGTSWSEPMMVAKPGLNVTTFPTLDAGADGRVAIVYLGTPSDKAIPDMEGDDHWHAYIAVLVNATGDDPLIAASAVDPMDDPIAKGPCDDDNRCNGIGDFIDIVIDTHGRPWAALVDVCNEECIEGTENDEALGKVGTLATGPALRGEPGALPPLQGAVNATQGETSGLPIG